MNYNEFLLIGKIRNFKYKDEEKNNGLVTLGVIRDNKNYKDVDVEDKIKIETSFYIGDYISRLRKGTTICVKGRIESRDEEVVLVANEIRR